MAKKSTVLERKPRVYSYVRISSDGQIGGTGIRRQIEAAEKFAFENGLEIDHELSLKDIGKSAYHGKHISEGDLGRFLQAIQNGKVAKGSILIIEDFDRLSRQPISQSASMMFNIINNGVDIVTLTDGKKYTAKEFDLSDMLTCAIKMSLAHEESEKKSLRGKANWDIKRTNAVGKKLTSRCPAWLKLNKETDSFEIDIKKKVVIARIFDDAINGMGAYAISRQLNKEGVLPFGRANGWHKSSVQKILSNRAVIGFFQPRKHIDGTRVAAGAELENYFPPIIEANIFNAAQGASSIRKEFGGGRRGESISNIFSKKLYCGYCGSKVHSVNKGSASGSFLTCDNRKRAMGCTAVPWKYDEFEREFFLRAGELKITEFTDENHESLEGGSVEEKLLSIRAQLEAEEKIRELNYDNMLISRESSIFFSEKIEESSRKILKLKNDEADLLKKRGSVDQIKKIHEVGKDQILEAIERLSDLSEDARLKARAGISSRIKILISKIFIYSGANIKLKNEKLINEYLLGKIDPPKEIEKMMSLLEGYNVREEKIITNYIVHTISPEYGFPRAIVVCYRNNQSSLMTYGQLSSKAYALWLDPLRE